MGLGLSAGPVEDHAQVDEAPRQADLRDVAAPDWVGPVNLHHPQQVGIGLVPGVRAAGGRPRHHARQAQDAHQPLDPLAVDAVAQRFQVDHPLAAAVERMPRVFGVDQGQQRQFPGVWFLRLAGRVDRGAGDARQFALAGQRQRPRLVDPALAVG